MDWPAGAAAVLGAELAAADDTAAGADAELPAVLVSEAVLGAELAAADDTAAGADAELPAAPVSEAVVDGLFEADAAAPMTTSAPNAMSPVSTLCRAGQDLCFCPFGVCGGMADCCCHGGSWGAYC
jgi:hypothetical protein